MGGPGSGRREQYNTAFCSSSFPVDIRALAQKNGLRTGAQFTCRWWVGDDTGAGSRIDGYIPLDCRTDGLPLRVALRYTVRENGGPWRHREDFIPITYTRCTKGGVRPWFVCPTCSRRCAVVYCCNGYQCRLCGNLRYRSQYQDAGDRMLYRSLKIRERYGQQTGGIHARFPSKPKWKHWRTWERDRRQAMDFIYTRWNFLDDRFKLRGGVR